jgi:hypothetical protein
MGESWDQVPTANRGMMDRQAKEQDWEEEEECHGCTANAGKSSLP